MGMPCPDSPPGFATVAEWHSRTTAAGRRSSSTPAAWGDTAECRWVLRYSNPLQHGQEHQTTSSAEKRISAVTGECCSTLFPHRSRPFITSDVETVRLPAGVQFCFTNYHFGLRYWKFLAKLKQNDNVVVNMSCACKALLLICVWDFWKKSLLNTGVGLSSCLLSILPSVVQ